VRTAAASTGVTSMPFVGCTIVFVVTMRAAPAARRLASASPANTAWTPTHTGERAPSSCKWRTVAIIVRPVEMMSSTTTGVHERCLERLGMLSMTSVSPRRVFVSTVQGAFAAAAATASVHWRLSASGPMMNGDSTFAAIQRPTSSPLCAATAGIE